MKREVLWLISAVLVVDAIFVAAYFLGHMGTASDPVKAAFTVLWTLVTLAIVIRGLYRVRRTRAGPAGPREPA
jgi:heme/copper-type cytochrome/quinol oxidase subunit 4